MALHNVVINAVCRAFRGRKPPKNADWVADLQRLRGDARFGVVFDVGANRGQTVGEFLKLMPGAKLFAFEPIPRLADGIREKFRDHPNLTVEALAMDEQVGARTFHVNAYDETSSFLPTATDTSTREYLTLREEIQVQTTTLDAFCAERKIDGIDVLKLDVQGVELPVLRGAGAVLPKVQAVYAEITFVKYYQGQTEFAQLDTILRDHGFRIFSLYHLMRGQDGRLLMCDGLWLNERTFSSEKRPLEAWESELNEDSRK